MVTEGLAGGGVFKGAFWKVKGWMGWRGDVKEANIGEYLQIKHGGD